MGFLLGAQVFPGGRVLTLASARASDSGSYSCVAVSAVGEDRRDVVLYVHSESQARGAIWSRPVAQEVGAGGAPTRPKGRGAVRCGGRQPETLAAFTWGSVGGELPCRGQVGGRVACTARSSVFREQIEGARRGRKSTRSCQESMFSLS